MSFETTLGTQAICDLLINGQAICYLPIYSDTAGGSKGGR